MDRPLETGRCEHTGLNRPECSCRACTRRKIMRHGTTAAKRWLSSDDDSPLDNREIMDTEDDAITT